MPKKFEKNRHLRIRVTGKVQGVFYRVEAQRRAQELGLSGYISNKSNGHVLIDVEGPEADLELFVKWCWKGSDMSFVKNVQIQEVAVDGYEGFILR